MAALGLIIGERTGWTSRKVSSSLVEYAVQKAMKLGFITGRRVFIGEVEGTVVGYNIASFGQFLGAIYPLVIRTPLGVTKCSLREVRLA